MITYTQKTEVRGEFSTPIGTLYLDRFCDLPGFLPNYPAGKPYFLVTCGQFFASVEDARQYLESLDFSEPTEADIYAAECQAEADRRQYMYLVEYACGIRD